MPVIKQVKFVVFEAEDEERRGDAENEISDLLQKGWQLADPLFRLSAAGAYFQHHKVVVMLIKYMG